MKYYIIAGEASGDLHGSNLVKYLRQLSATSSIRCWGGDLMQAEGAELVKHYRDLAFMGFAEVIKNLPTILQNISFCKSDIEAYQPDAIILIDYPGFNLRIAAWAKKKGYKVIYYIAPQVWAWKENRVRAMKQNIDLMLTILPFEKEFFKTRWNWSVTYVGHPLAHLIETYKANHPADKSKKIIALLPGSRKQEIKLKLPIMLQTSRAFPQFQFVVALAPGQEDSFYTPFLNSYKNIQTTRNTYELLNNASAALVTSGTATLETALFGVPEVVCYKGSNLSYQIAKRLIRIKFISLANLIMDKPIVRELIQQELTTNNLVTELQDLLFNEERKEAVEKNYQDLQALLHSNQDASYEAAKSIVHFMQQINETEEVLPA
jgi:lipid-A-disaccharide synthase